MNSAELQNARPTLGTEYSPDFFYLCRLLECAHPELPRVGESLLPQEEAVRFCQEPSLAFAPTAVPKFVAGGEAPGGRVFINFMGLLGPNGPLPIHLTDFARDRERNHGDPTLARFLDVFNHRMVTLFYRAWAVNQITVSLDRPEDDRYSRYIGSLCGLGTPGLLGRDRIPDHAKLYFTGRLSAATANAEGLAAIIREYFRVPSEVHEFIGRWIPLPRAAWCRLGDKSGSSVLGGGAVAGRHVWECQSCIRVRLGPMTLADYERMLPGGPSHAALHDWVKLYTGSAIDMVVQLCLLQREVPRPRLGGPRAGGSMLGWTTWLNSGSAPRDADDLVVAANVAEDD